MKPRTIADRDCWAEGILALNRGEAWVHDEGARNQWLASAIMRGASLKIMKHVLDIMRIGDRRTFD